MLTKIMHEFIIVDDQFITKNTGHPVFLAEFNNKEDKIKIHDDIILFIWNTLKLLRCRDYKNKKEKFGLFYDGDSYIYNDQLELFSKIIILWLSFVDLASEKIIINKEDDEYDSVIVREDLVKLLQLVRKALQEKKSILHIGV
jgi:hypothetical protein